jgi:hypothetical protein
MSWKEHLRDLDEIETNEVPSPRLFEVVRYMLDRPIAIPLRALEEYLGNRIESAWDAILGSKHVDDTLGLDSEWKNVDWFVHTDRESVPYISFATLKDGEVPQSMKL